MSSEKSLYGKTKKLSSKVKSSVKSVNKKPAASSKKLSQSKVSVRPKKPELSVVNVIEQISQILRKEVRDLERRKASGE